MALTPTKRFVNVTSCSFTPTGGSTVNLTGTQSVVTNSQAADIKGSGDGDFYNTVAGVVSADWMATVETNEPALLNSVAIGTYGVLVWTINDARNGVLASGGAITYTLSNAYFMGPNLNAPHRNFATASFVFHSYSADGVTSPMAASAL